MTSPNIKQSSTFKRKWWANFLLEKGFHFRQIRRLLVVTTCMVIISSIAMGMFYNEMMDLFTSGDLPAYFMPEDMARLDAQIPGFRATLLHWIAIIFCINFVVCLFIGILITNKLGGPLFKFKQSMHHISMGKLYTIVEIRQGDEFQDMAESINRMVSTVQLMILAINENIDRLEKSMEGNENNSDIEQAIEGCRCALSFFETITIPKSCNEE